MSDIGGRKNSSFGIRRWIYNFFYGGDVFSDPIQTRPTTLEDELSKARNEMKDYNSIGAMNPGHLDYENYLECGRKLSVLEALDRSSTNLKCLGVEEK